MDRRYIVIGNSGSGKSTLAHRLATHYQLAHLDLDVLAWLPRDGDQPPARRPLADSERDIERFVGDHAEWVIEGCYSDLIAAAMPRCSQLVFLNPGTAACIENARARPWEPHKYPSKRAQDDNLAMLIDWIGDYATRDDEFSLRAHRALFDRCSGPKIELASREAIAAFRGD